MDTSALRNFKDFLQLYNRMTEICFNRCIDNINSRNLEQNEMDCVNDCASKFIKFNNKLMHTFVKLQTDIVNRRVEETEKQQQLSSSTVVENALENDKIALAEQKNDLEKHTLQGKEDIQLETIISEVVTK